MQGGAQEGHVSRHDEHGAQGRRQEPTARVMGANERRQVHDELVLARLELNRIARLRLGDRLRVNRAERIEHALTALLVKLERDLANATVEPDPLNAFDIRAELDKRVEIALWHRTRQLEAGPARDLADNRESHVLSRYSATLPEVASTSLSVMYVAFATMSSTSAFACSTMSW